MRRFSSFIRIDSFASRSRPAGLVAILALVILAGAMPATVPAQEAEPDAVLAMTAGAVTIHRGDGTVEASFGAALLAGDVVQTGDGAQAAVLFASGQIIELGPGSRITIGGLPGSGDGSEEVMAQVPDAFSGSLGKFAQTAAGDEGLSALPTLRGGDDDDRPTPLSPRNTLVAGTPAEFTWTPVEEVLEYRVVLTSPEGADAVHRSGRHLLTLPEDAAVFQPGEPWSWRVEAITEDGAVVSETVTFEVASETTHQELKNLHERLSSLLGSSDKARADAARYLLGSYCRSTGFYGEAIDHLEVLAERHPGRKELHRELGSLYQIVGRNDRAAEEYRLALKD